MKKKLLIADLVLAVLATGFTVYGHVQTRGIKVYLLPTGRGHFLSLAWQIALPVALVLWLAGVFLAISILTRREKESKILIAPTTGVPGQTQPQANEAKRTRGERTTRTRTARTVRTEPGREKIQPRRAGEGDGRIPPAAPAAGTAEKPTDVLPSEGVPTHALPTEDAPTDVLPAGEAPTDVLPDGEAPTDVLPNGDAPTDVLPPENAPKDAPKDAAPRGGDATDVLPAADAPADGHTAAAAPAGDVFCGNCGAKVTGKKFCPYCGKRVQS